MTLTYAQVENLDGNLPENYSVPIDNLTDLAAAIPLVWFDTTLLVNLISSEKSKLDTLEDTISTLVFSSIPVATLNALTTDQSNGLTISQVSNESRKSGIIFIFD